MNNEIVLTESKSLREEILQETNIEKMDEVLNKVKGLILLPDETNVTMDMVSDYYEVDKKLIEYHIKQNKDELESDGLKVLKGKELKDFKGYLVTLGDLDSKIKTSPTLTLIPRRAILRLGMLIQKSEIAKQVRTYLLNVEENSDINTKLISISQDTFNNIISLQDDMKLLKQNNDIIMAENEELKTNTYNLINKIDEILNQPLFKLYTNNSSNYEKLIIEFTDIMREKGYYHGNYGKDYGLFNREFSKWTGVDFGNKTLNKKDYWLNYYGLEIIKHFIYGIKQGTIIQSNNGYWIDLNGIYCNKVEYNRTLKEFDYKCAYCGNDGILLAEHIFPQSSEYSTDQIYNIIPSCKHCNDSKLNNYVKDWYKNQSFFTEERYEKIRNHYKKYKINK